MQVLAACLGKPDVNTMEVMAGDDTSLTQEELQQITGPVPPVGPWTKDGENGMVLEKYVLTVDT